MEDKPKKPTSAEVIANMPRRDTYSSEHGSGNPHLNPGELQDSEAWKSHKPAKQITPKKKA
jgi:hypothetical protein